MYNCTCMYLVFYWDLIASWKSIFNTAPVTDIIRLKQFAPLAYSTNKKQYVYLENYYLLFWNCWCLKLLLRLVSFFYGSVFSLTNLFCKQVDWSKLHINNLKVIQKSVLQEIQKSFENAYDCTASRRCIGKVKWQAQVNWCCQENKVESKTFWSCIWIFLSSDIKRRFLNF